MHTVLPHFKIFHSGIRLFVTNQPAVWGWLIHATATSPCQDKATAVSGFVGSLAASLLRTAYGRCISTS